MKQLATFVLILFASLFGVPTPALCQITATCTSCEPVVTPGFDTNLGTTVSIGGTVTAAWPECTFSGNACVPSDDHQKCVFSRVKSVTFGPYDAGVVHGELLENDNGDELGSDSTRYPAGPTGSTYAEGGTLRLPCGITFTESLTVPRLQPPQPLPPRPPLEVFGRYSCNDCVIASVIPEGGGGG